MNKKIILGLLSLVILLFASCKIEPIFYAIEKEVPLKKAVIKGNLYAMTEFKGKLYAATGTLYTKGASVKRGWEKVSGLSGHIIRVASDDSNIYALSSDKKLYTSTDGETWTAINDLTDIVELFDNKANGSDKEAYVTTKESIFILDGDSASLTSPPNGTKESIAAVFDGTSTIFSDTTLIAAGSMGIYTSTGNKITFKDKDFDIKVGNPKSMAVYNDGSKEHLLVGTTNGLKRINLDENGVPKNIGSELGDNADSSFALVEIPTLYSFADSIYVATVASDHGATKKTKVWAYYTNRPEWNVE